MLQGINSLPQALFNRRTPYILSDVGGTIYFNPLSCPGTHEALVTLTGTGRTFKTVNNLPPGRWAITLLQDATGSRTITTWPSNWVWLNQAPPTLSYLADRRDVLYLENNGLVTMASIVTSGGTEEIIETQTLPGAAASITSAQWSTTFQHIRIDLSGNLSAEDQSLFFRLGPTAGIDSGANYTSVGIIWNSGGTAVYSYNGVTIFQVNYGNLLGNNIPWKLVVDIPFVQNLGVVYTKFFYYNNVNSLFQSDRMSGFWNGTLARLIAFYTSGANFGAGTTMTIRGIRGLL